MSILYRVLDENNRLQIRSSSISQSTQIIVSCLKQHDFGILELNTLNTFSEKYKHIISNGDYKLYLFANSMFTKRDAYNRILLDSRFVQKLDLGIERKVAIFPRENSLLVLNWKFAEKYAALIHGK